MALVTSEKIALKTRVSLDALGAQPQEYRDDRTFAGIQFIKDLEDPAVASQVNYVPNLAGRPNPQGLGVGVCPEQTHRVQFMLPDCADKTEVDVTFDCTAATATKETYGEVEVTINDYIGDEFSIDANDFDCETDTTPSKAFQVALRRSVIKQLVNYNAKLITKMYAGLGQSYSDATKGFGGNPINLPLFDAAGQLPQPMAFFEISDEYARQFGSMADVKYLASSKKLRAYLFSQGVFSGNEFGNDSSRSSIVMGDYYLDNSMQATLIAAGEVAGTTDPIISAQMGSVLILENYKFQTAHKRVSTNGAAYFAPMQYSGTLLRQTMDIGTETVGMELIADVQFHYEECDNLIHVKWRKDFDLWKRPQERFCPSPSGAAYNGCLLWNATCEDLTCPV